ncbi:MAG: hypothetical protein IKF24_05465 [Eubacterium sp.]|nr:hypothetical protein [Eubacterium sp.]
MRGEKRKLIAIVMALALVVLSANFVPNSVSAEDITMTDLPNQQWTNIGGEFYAYSGSWAGCSAKAGTNSANTQAKAQQKGSGWSSAWGTQVAICLPDLTSAVASGTKYNISWTIKSDSTDGVIQTTSTGSNISLTGSAQTVTGTLVVNQDLHEAAWVIGMGYVGLSNAITFEQPIVTDSQGHQVYPAETPTDTQTASQTVTQTSTVAPTTTEEAGYSAATLGDWTFADAPGTSGWQYFVHANSTGSKYKGGTGMNDPLFIKYGAYVEGADYSCMARSPITTVTPGSNCAGTISITSSEDIGESGAQVVGASVYAYNSTSGEYTWLSNASESATNVVADTKTTFHINYTAPDTGKIVYVLTTSYTPVATLKFEATHSETTTAAPTTTAEPGYSAATLGAWTFADAPGTSGWQYFVHANSTGSTYKGGTGMNDPLFIKYGTYVEGADYSCMARSPITTVTAGNSCTGTISITSSANIGGAGDKVVGAAVYAYNSSTGEYTWLAGASEEDTNVVADTKTTFHLNYTAPETGKVVYILTTSYTPVATLKFEATHSEQTPAPTTTTKAPTTSASDWIDVPDATATTVGAWTLFANYAEWAQLQYKNKVSTPTDMDDTLIKVKNPTGWYNWNCTAKLANYCTGKMTAGDAYKITINVNSSMATETGHTIRVAIDNVIYYYELDSGNNALEINGLTYTGSSPDVTFDLSLLSQGTVLDFSSIVIEPYEDPSTTVPETTTAPPVVDPEIELTGYQINVSQEGFRMVGQVEPTVNGHSVTEFGFVYGLSKIYKPSTDSYQDTGITDADMEVGASSQYIVSYPTTSTGIIENKMGHSTTATYFARTMTFGKKNKAAFASKYKVRVYAKLDNNEYRYSEKIYNFSVFDIADALYQGCLMNNLTNHDYLYNTILTKVNPDYESVPFEYSHKVAVPGEKNS